MLPAAERLFNILYPVCAIVGFVTCGYKIRDFIRGPRSLALVALVAARLWPALSFTAATPAVYRWIDQQTGVPNLATLLVYTLIVLNSVTAQVLLLLWSFPADAAGRKVLPRMAVGTAVLVTMTALFFAADVPGEHPVDFDVYYARTPLVAVFLVIYLGFFAVGLGASAVLTWRFSQKVPRPWLRRGLRLNAVGALFGLGYAAAKAVSVAARWTGSDQLDAVNVIWAPISASAGALLIAFSSTLPAWGPGAEQLWQQAQTYRRLEPLWLALYRLQPAIALQPPRSVRYDRWSPRDLDHRLYRRLIEIRDGYHALKPWFREDVAQTARRDATDRGVAGETLEAVVTAAVVAAAVQARTRGDSPETAPANMDPVGTPNAGSASDDSAWLAKVSSALRDTVISPGLHPHDRDSTRL